MSAKHSSKWERPSASSELSVDLRHRQEGLQRLWHPLDVGDLSDCEARHLRGGRRWSRAHSAKALWVSGPSRLTPKRAAPAAVMSVLRSRKLHASLLQPGVKSFG